MHEDQVKGPGLNRLFVCWAFALMACGGHTTPVTPKQDLLAADSARATLLAALFDAPPEILRPVVTPPIPRGTARPPSAIVIAFAVDSTGSPVTESMTIIYLEAEKAFARKVCAAIPKLRYAPVAKPGPFLMLVPFVSFEPPMPTRYEGLYAQIKEKFEKMSAIERRDFFLDKGCRRYQ